jgi:hypothetical protein
MDSKPNPPEKNKETGQVCPKPIGDREYERCYRVTRYAFFNSGKELCAEKKVSERKHHYQG